MKTQQPAGPICQNCAMTQRYCETVREIDRRACCYATCEHYDLPPLDA